MKVFDITTIGFSSSIICVVAESMEEARKVFFKKYPNETIKRVELRKDVLVQDDSGVDKMEARLCELRPPATCEFKVDGKMSHICLCGCHRLSEIFLKCPYKLFADIIIKREDTDFPYNPDEHSWICLGSK